jgi:hypothetical protein
VAAQVRVRSAAAAEALLACALTRVDHRQRLLGVLHDEGVEETHVALAQRSEGDVAAD